MSRIRTPDRRPELGAMPPASTAPDRRRYYGLSGLVIAWDAAFPGAAARARPVKRDPTGIPGSR